MGTSSRVGIRKGLFTLLNFYYYLWYSSEALIFEWNDFIVCHSSIGRVDAVFKRYLLQGSELKEVQCAHLLVKHAGSRRPASWRSDNITRSKEDALAILEGYIQQIKSSSDPQETFRKLASEFSDCSSAKRGGDLGVSRLVDWSIWISFPSFPWLVIRQVSPAVLNGLSNLNRMRKKLMFIFLLLCHQVWVRSLSFSVDSPSFSYFPLEIEVDRV